MTGLPGISSVLAGETSPADYQPILDFAPSQLHRTGRRRPYMAGIKPACMSALHEIITQPLDGQDASLIVSRLGSKVALADLAGKRGYLMVSVKNSSFTTQTVDRFCDLVETYLDAGEVILVDTPYAATIVASETDETFRRRKLENLAKAARDRRRFVETVLARRSAAIPIRSFDQVDDEVPPALRREVRHAFEADGEFRRALLARSRDVIPRMIPDVLLPRYAEFLVSEIPVLCHLYYASCAPGVVDVYPGENPLLFWDIERGRYARELPGITALAARSPGLIYVDVSLNGGRGNAGSSSFCGRL
jgi:tRNA-dependent cyclodipeptide synthase